MIPIMALMRVKFGEIESSGTTQGKIRTLQTMDIRFTQTDIRNIKDLPGKRQPRNCENQF
jgi:hypothetical protein